MASYVSTRINLLVLLLLLIDGKYLCFNDTSSTCGSCPKNTILDKNGKCHYCNDNEIIVNNTCDPCPSGTYKNDWKCDSCYDRCRSASRKTFTESVPALCYSVSYCKKKIRQFIRGKCPSGFVIDLNLGICDHCQFACEEYEKYNFGQACYSECSVDFCPDGFYIYVNKTRIYGRRTAHCASCKNLCQVQKDKKEFEAELACHLDKECAALFREVVTKSCPEEHELYEMIAGECRTCEEMCLFDKQEGMDEICNSSCSMFLREIRNNTVVPTRDFDPITTIIIPTFTVPALVMCMCVMYKFIQRKRKSSADLKQNLSVVTQATKQSEGNSQLLVGDHSFVPKSTIRHDKVCVGTQATILSEEEDHLLIGNKSTGPTTTIKHMRHNPYNLTPLLLHNYRSHSTPVLDNLSLSYDRQPDYSSAKPCAYRVSHCTDETHLTKTAHMDNTVPFDIKSKSSTILSRAVNTNSLHSSLIITANPTGSLPYPRETIFASDTLVSMVWPSNPPHGEQYSFTQTMSHCDETASNRNSECARNINVPSIEHVVSRLNLWPHFRYIEFIDSRILIVFDGCTANQAHIAIQQLTGLSSGRYYVKQISNASSIRSVYSQRSSLSDISLFSLNCQSEVQSVSSIRSSLTHTSEYNFVETVYDLSDLNKSLTTNKSEQHIKGPDELGFQTNDEIEHLPRDVSEIPNIENKLQALAKEGWVKRLVCNGRYIRVWYDAIDEYNAKRLVEEKLCIENKHFDCLYNRPIKDEGNTSKAK